MASHHHHQSSHPPPHCCCNPSYSCCTTPPHQYQCHLSPPHDHLVQPIASLLFSQPHPIPTTQLHLKSHNNLHPRTQNHHHHHSTTTISSLLRRIESLESSLSHHSHTHTHHYHSQSLRHAAARVIQTHFRSFLARRSRTLSHLKRLASIKSSFTSLRSSFSSHTHLDFPSLSLKAVNLLLQLDSIQDCDPMIVDGKRSISRDLVQFLDAIEEVAAKKHMRCVKAARNPRSGHKVHRPRNSGGDDDEKRKMLQNLRGRVEKIGRLCKVYANDEEGSEPEEGIRDDDGVTNVLIGRRDGMSQNKNGVFVQRQGVQPRVKKSVRFAENGNVCEVFSSRTCESDGSSSSSGEVLENVSCAVEDVVDSSQGAEDDDEEALVVDSGGGSPLSSDDGEQNLKNDGRNIVNEQLQAHQERFLFSAPLPLKMENRTDLKSKGVKILS